MSFGISVAGIGRGFDSPGAFGIIGFEFSILVGGGIGVVVGEELFGWVAFV